MKMNFISVFFTTKKEKLILILTFLVVFSFSTYLFAARYPASDCGATSLGPPPQQSGCSSVDAWCEIVEDATSEIPGTVSPQESATHLSSNCTENCDDVEKPQPDTVHDTISLSTCFTTKIVFTSSGTVGVSWLNAFEASFSLGASLENGKEVCASVQRTIDLSPCAWSTHRAALSVTKGQKTIKVAKIAAYNKYSCRGNIITLKGPDQQGSAIVTCDFAAVSFAGTVANGTCPPDPPGNN